MRNKELIQINENETNWCALQCITWWMISKQKSLKMYLHSKYRQTHKWNLWWKWYRDMKFCFVYVLFALTILKYYSKFTFLCGTEENWERKKFTIFSLSHNWMCFIHIDICKINITLSWTCVMGCFGEVVEMELILHNLHLYKLIWKEKNVSFLIFHFHFFFLFIGSDWFVL